MLNSAVRILAHPWLAIVFGGFILCAETCNHIDAIVRPSHWYELPIYDWSAGGFLLAVGLVGRRGQTRVQPYQAAAWGYMLSLLVGAFFAHWEEWSTQPQSDGGLSPGTFIGILAALVAVGSGGLLATLAKRRSPP